MLSHGAIIAREFGIPCVVGVKRRDATRFRTGATVTRRRRSRDRGPCRSRELHRRVRRASGCDARVLVPLAFVLVRRRLARRPRLAPVDRPAFVADAVAARSCSSSRSASGTTSRIASATRASIPSRVLVRRAIDRAASSCSRSCSSRRRRCRRALGRATAPRVRRGRSSRSSFSSAWYRRATVSTRAAGRRASSSLLKYPLRRVCARPRRRRARLASLYSRSCVYEIVDDPALRHRRRTLASRLRSASARSARRSLSLPFGGRSHDGARHSASRGVSVAAGRRAVRDGRLLPVRRAAQSTPFIEARGRPDGQAGTFTFVTCDACGLRYQNPRVALEHIKDYYDDEYIAHRKKNWGVLNRLLRPGDGPARPAEGPARVALRRARRARARCSTSAARSARFCTLRARYGARATGVDFKDLARTRRSPASSSTAASSTSRLRRPSGSTSSRCGTSSSTTTIRCAACGRARDLLEARRAAGDRSAAARQHDVPPVRPSLAGPAGAAAHGALRSRAPARSSCERRGSRSSTICRTARSRRYFYLFTGAAFKLLKGKGLNLDAGDLSVLRRQDPARADPRVREAAEPRDADGRLPEARMKTRTASRGGDVRLHDGRRARHADRRDSDALPRAALLLRGDGALDREMVLRICGVRYRVHGAPPSPAVQTV